MGPPLLAAASVYARKPKLTNEFCSGIECMIADVLDPIVVLLWTGALALVVLATLTYLRAARSECVEECSRTRKERDAFDRFVRRVSAMDVAPSGHKQSRPGGTTIVRTRSGTDDGGLQEIQQAYRETVMSVPHFDEEYDESLAANMAAEFGEELATAVLGGTRLTPQLKEALVRKAREASRQRADLLGALDGEFDDLDEQEEALAGIDRRLDRLDKVPLTGKAFDELEDTWDRLEELEGECASVLSQRQRRIRSEAGVRTDGGDPHGFYIYLYRSLDVTYPVLAEGTALLEEIRTAQDRVLRALTNRA